MKPRAFRGWAVLGVTATLACLALAGKSRVFAQTPTPVTQGAAQQATNSVEALFEKSAKELEFFDLSPFLYNRESLDFGAKDPNAGKTYFATLAKVTDAKLPLEPIKALLTHANPRVRTLALAALFNREDPRPLPVLVELAEDKAPTFPGHGALSESWYRFSGVGPPKQAQTVGDVATAMVDFYTSRAKFVKPISAGRRGLSQPVVIPTYGTKFADYWKVLGKRPYNASWFEVKLARASRGTSPTQPEYLPDLRRLRAKLNTIPRADRNWALLYLNAEAGSDVLASDEELKEAARELGPAPLMAWLKGQPVSTMPDLVVEDWKKKVVLRNARLLLEPAQSDELLKRGEFLCGKDGDSALWFVAAADLNSTQNGRSILKAAWPKFQDRFDGDEQIDLAVALARKGNREDWPFLANWFFAPKPKEYDGTSSTGRQADFLSRLAAPPVVALAETRVQEDEPVSATLRQLMAYLVKDPRFDDSEFWAVYRMLRIVNVSQPKPLADSQKFYEEAWIGDPKRSEAQAALKAMKSKLRATSGQWSR